MPEDILIQILQQLMEDLDIESDDVRDVTARTTIFLVCRLLCQVMLNSPILWSKISCKWPISLFKLYMERAGRTSLIIKGWDAPLVDPNEYFSRAKSVDLSFRHQWKGDNLKLLQVQDVLKRQSPRLETLINNCYDQDLELTPSFLGGNPHSLQELNIVYFRLGSGPSLRSLRRLTIRKRCEEDRLWSIFDVFRGTPHMEDLTLIRVSNGRGTPYDYDTAEIRLSTSANGQ
jgi:hypothetical protein